MKILVIGCAKSGIGAAKLAANAGQNVAIYDDKRFEDFADETKQALIDLENKGVKLFLGKRDSYIDDIEKIIVSPGVPLDIPIIEHYRKENVNIVGEFEFAATFCKAPILGITGTNGKTTTTTLVGEIFKAYNPKTFVVGNIGCAFSEEVQDITADSVVIAELSSFQLETIETLSCQICSILNITPDHLNRHGTMENYMAAKYRIFENGGKNVKVILNKEDAELAKLIGKTGKTELLFSSKESVEKGVYLENGALVDNTLGDNFVICNIDELHILGVHNYENALAAILMARAYGVPREIIRSVLLDFRGVAHRIEYVTTVSDVKFYNDSKATNVGAAVPGLLAMQSKIRLIGGGLDKHIEFDEWVELFEGRVAKLYIIGETTNQIIETCKKHGFHNYEAFETFEEAIKAAYNEAKRGECVLLSPACASWDMFPSYEVRGEIFKQVALSLREGAKDER
ncbi:UDP-N-acetylmuramoyl-L-alanine--D-glutamate ligase [Candidatus Epulonipiscium viviparus]|uniref:UDP-N-acetylmuramoyl-L-alanine--D-glutamate ligase n=1 Tax=Candidatus Epulonipiscium viviparus TaxID=420336 RepID=UPI000495E6F7|nr:UDP-N-acetylmuramoyl-L-alanine--D-glutamate ligase [Candidatus Epulopiscium viviparus]